MSVELVNGELNAESVEKIIKERLSGWSVHASVENGLLNLIVIGEARNELEAHKKVFGAAPSVFNCCHSVTVHWYPTTVAWKAVVIGDLVRVAVGRLQERPEFIVGSEVSVNEKSVSLVVISPGFVDRDRAARAISAVRGIEGKILDVSGSQFLNVRAETGLPVYPGEAGYGDEEEHSDTEGRSPNWPSKKHGMRSGKGRDNNPPR